LISNSLDKSYQELKDAIPYPEQLGSDETTFKNNGKKNWIWCIASALFTVFHVAPTRSRTVLEELVGEEFAGYLNFDYFSANCSFAWNYWIKARYCTADTVNGYLKSCELAAGRFFADVAAGCGLVIGFCGRVLKTAFNAVADDSVHVNMQTKRSRHKPLNAGVFLCSFRDQCRNVLAPVSARRKEVRKNDHPFCAALNTSLERRRNCRLGQFHMSRFHNLTGGTRCKPFRRLKK